MAKHFARWAMLALALLVFVLAFLSNIHDRKLMKLETTIEEIRDNQALILELQEPRVPQPLKSDEPREI